MYVEGEVLSELVLGTDKRWYFNQVRMSMDKYFAVVNEMYQTNPQIAGLVDKPNENRLVELCIDTGPKYGHLRAMYLTLSLSTSALISVQLITVETTRRTVVR